MTNNKQYDLIVIGSGPGGYVAAIKAAQLGMHVAVVEQESLGGVCLNWGCIPTKALLKSAQVFDYLKNAQDYGIHVSDVKPDFDAMIRRSRTAAQKMQKGVQFLFKKNNIDTLHGVGKIGENRTVSVVQKDNSTIYQAKHIIIATGSRSKALPQIPVDGQKVIGYREAMTLPQQPKSIIIVGAGAIGVEFAYFYHTIGTAVTLIENAPSILPREDADISHTMAKILTKAGIQVHTQASVTHVDTQGAQCQLHFNNQAGGSKKLSSDIILSAVGIAANIKHIGLEELGVAIDQDKVSVDDFYRTNVPGIYAIGDIVKGPALAHVASAEGIVCVEKIAGLHPEPLNYHNLPACIYSQPEIASVGYTATSAREAGYNVKIGKFPFSASGKATTSGTREGFIKVIFDAKYGEWLGAQMIGANVTEMIAEVVVARKLETTAHEIIQSVHPHPTMSEGIMEAVADAYGEAIHV